jgi:hypothetical protein
MIICTKTLNKMKINISAVLFFFLLLIGSNTYSQNEVMDLSGIWDFQLDDQKVGKLQKWHLQKLRETITLPGTTDENKKGVLTDSVDLTKLNRKFFFEGQAWYQKKIDIPKSWTNKKIKLFLERTKATEIWIDDTYFPLQKTLLSPHLYDVTDALTPGTHFLTILVDNSSSLFPVGGSHALTDHTQTNWNGIIGRIELVANNMVDASIVNMVPDIDKKLIRVTFNISNPDSENLNGKLVVEAKGFNGNNHEVKSQTFKIQTNKKEFIVEKEFNMGNSFSLWSEFNPNLYTLNVSFTASNSKKYNKTFEETFGMRKFETRDRHFYVNGLKIFLRGKNDACIFPLTGYPPMTKEEWIRQMKISKSYGINSYRFHSWTPPKACFEAADIVGIYLQAELPNWGSYNDSGVKDATYQFQKEEGINSLLAYRMHPSFVMLSLGNELSGSRDLISEMINELRQFANKILISQGANNFYWDPKIIANEDYFINAKTSKYKPDFSSDIRASNGFVDDPNGGGVLNRQKPNSVFTFSKALEDVKIPVVSHETGQYQVLPNYDEIPKYTGILIPRNFIAFKQKMMEKNMFPYWKELFDASGKLAVLCYKADNEMLLRTPELAGFQILDIQDFPGQGTALVGVLDAFMDSKGIVTPDKWRQACNAVTVQAKMNKFTWLNTDEFSAESIVINYSHQNIRKAVQWNIMTADNKIVASGKFNSANCKQGEITTAGNISARLSNIEKPQQLTLNLFIDETDIKNQYSIWVYPPVKTLDPNKSFIETNRLDKLLIEQLNKGANILLFPDSASIVSNSVGGLFTSDYWCYPMYKPFSVNNNLPVSPGTLGLLIDNTHPVFDGFPTSKYSDWLWWSIVKKSRPIIIDNTRAEYRPIIQAVDNFDRCSKLGMLLEFNVGKGKIFICSADLSDEKDIFAQTLRRSIYNYVGSTTFSPKENIDANMLMDILYKGSGYVQSSKTAEPVNTND